MPRLPTSPLSLAAVTATLVLACAANAFAFTCKVSTDKKTATLVGTNAQARDTSCTVHCDIKTSTGATAILECTREVPANAKDHEFCTKTNDNGATYERIIAQYGSCVDQSAVKQDKDDDEADVRALPDPQKLKDQLGADVPPEVKKMLDRMKQ